jgi:hypothetical protein
MFRSYTMRCLAAGAVWLAACAPGTTSTPAPAVSAGEVREIVGVLAADSLEGRRTGTPGGLRAARFLAERMRSYGLEPGGDSSYFQRVLYESVTAADGEQLRLARGRGNDSVPVRQITDYNVIGLIPGSDSSLRDEAVVLGAHFDHLGIGVPVEGDSIYNGADDDASGVAAVLAAARALAKAPARRTVIVLLTSGEESGVLGTQWYLERPAFPLAGTVADLQVEMVGRPDSLATGAPRWARGSRPPGCRWWTTHALNSGSSSAATTSSSRCGGSPRTPCRPSACTRTTTSPRTRWSGSTSPTWSRQRTSSAARSGSWRTARG